MQPFSRDALFVSIYEACKHRPTALDDAGALTNTIIARLVPAAEHGKLGRNTIITIVHETLDRFDKTAAAVYAAYHKA